MPTTVGTNPSTPFGGKGFEPNPTTAGRLNSNAWAVTSWSDAPNNLTFGGTATTTTTNDFARGATNAAQSTGGIYAFTGTPASPTNPMLMVQPVNSEFNPGTITLRFVNNGTTPMSAVRVKYKLYCRDDASNTSFFNLQWSNDGINFYNVPAADYTSPAGSSGSSVFLANDVDVNITGFGVPVTQYGYIRWISADAGGASGARDEFFLDDIELTASYAAPCTPPTTNGTATFSGLLPGQVTVNYTRGTGSGGLMVVAVPTNVLSAQPLNSVVYTADNNFGAGSAIGNGFVVYNSNAGGPGSFTVYNLTPGTLYRFYLFEYNVISNPCYITPLPSPYLQTTPTPVTSPTGFFRSRQTGYWIAADSWESAPALAGPWVTADLKPTSAAAGIEIRNNHTITLTANESARLLKINAGCKLTSTNITNGGWVLDLVNDGTTAYDLIVEGTLELFGNSPINNVTNTAATANVLAGGVVSVKANYPPSQSDDFAYLGTLALPRSVFDTDAIFEWNTNLFTFENSNRTYFNPTNPAKSPIFRLSQPPNFSVGAAAITTVNGHFEANADVVFVNAGVKNFRDGISGTGKVTQAASSGAFNIGATNISTARIHGTGIIELNGAGLNILNTGTNNWTRLLSNKTINNGTTTVNNGWLWCGEYILNGTTNFVLNAGGYLGIGSPDGITTGAAGNIQTSGGRNFNSGAFYYYVGLTDQVTGNALPSSIASLRLLPETIGNTITLTNDLQISGTFWSFYEANLNISDRTLELAFTSGVNINNPTVTATNDFGFIGNENSTIICSGTASYGLIFNSGGAKLGTLRINKTSGTASLNNVRPLTLEIYHGIEFTPANTTSFNFNNRDVVLKSTLSHTAYLGRIYGGAINMANFTVERYIATGSNHAKSWQFISMPLHTNSTQTIHASWQEGAATPNANPNPGFGTMITGAVANATDPSVGFDVYTQSGATVKVFNQVTGIYENILNTKSTKVANGKGYMILVRGDRSVITHNAPANPTVLRAKGILADNFTNPPAIVSVPANSFQSVGNPYACEIDFTTVFKNGGMDDVFYVWDPTLSGAYGLGGYQTISSANGFVPVPGGTLNYPTGVPVTKIQSGQAFLVHATASAGNMVFEEANKTVGSNMVFRNNTVTYPSLSVNLITSQGVLADGSKVVFAPNFNNAYTGMDALKYLNTGENIYTIVNGKRIAVDSRKSPSIGDTIQYGINNLPNGNYNLEIDVANLPARGNMRAILKDRFTGEEHQIHLSGKTTVSVTFSSLAASKAVDRFYIVFTSNRPTFATSFTEERQLKLWPNPLTGSVLFYDLSDCEDGNYLVTFTNIAGTPIVSQNIVVVNGRYNGKLNLPASLQRGIYRFKVQGANFSWSEQVVK